MSPRNVISAPVPAKNRVSIVEGRGTPSSPVTSMATTGRKRSLVIALPSERSPVPLHEQRHASLTTPAEAAEPPTKRGRHFTLSAHARPRPSMRSPATFRRRVVSMRYSSPDI